MYAVFRPGTTNTGNLTLTIEGWAWTNAYPGLFTNDQFTIAPNGTQELDRVFCSAAMINDDLTEAAGFDDLTLTVNSGTVHTGDQVFVYIDKLDLYTTADGVYNPFWDTRTILNAIYAVLDEMRTCVVPAWPYFLDGYIGRGTTETEATNNMVQQASMYWSGDGGGTGYGRLAGWNGPVWAGTQDLGDGSGSNEWDYATLWSATNRALSCWTGQAWAVNYRWIPIAPASGTFDDNGLGYTDGVHEVGAWIDVTNAVMTFPDNTCGSTNTAALSERGFRMQYADEYGYGYSPIWMMLRLDTDTNFICTPR